MSKSQRLSKRQLAVIEDLFVGELDEPAVLDKHKVKPNLFNRWLANEPFASALELRIARSYQAGQVILARRATQAANKLVALTECEKEETARKACLDIINMKPTTSARPANATSTSETSKETKLSPETASRLLAVLAQDEEKQTNLRTKNAQKRR